MKLSQLPKHERKKFRTRERSVLGRAFTGINSTRNRLTLARVVMSRMRRHEDPTDPFRLPTYRHPQSRRVEREMRQLRDGRA